MNFSRMLHYELLTPLERHVSELNETLRERGMMAEQVAARDGITFLEALETTP